MIKPFSFDLETCKEMLGEDTVRKLEEQAGADIKNGTHTDYTIDTHEPHCWDQRIWRQRFKKIVYDSAYNMKQEKLERLNTKFEIDPELMESCKMQIEKLPKAWEEFKSGKDKALGSLMGPMVKERKYSPIQIKQAFDDLKNAIS